MEKILTKKDFPKWVKMLGLYDLFAPQRNNDMWSYEPVEDTEAVDLDYLNSTVPPKKIIFPQREIFLEFGNSEEEGLQIKEVLPEERPAVIIGLRPCDGKAVILMDKVFSGQFEDPYYWKRRNSTTFVGLACNTPPSPNCFCLSVNGSPFSKDGLDILMTDLGNIYYLESLTKKGTDLLSKSKHQFQEPKPKDKQLLQQTHKDSEKKINRQINNVKSIPDKLKKMFDSPFWDEEAMSCIRCGICTYLCPTCHCFDISDEVIANSPLKGKRVRTWDTCQFPDFTMHSSGHNPRPDRASRLRQRILHKFRYFVEIYNHFQCVGCGRCVSKCPVGIDIIEVVNKVRNYEP